MYQQYMNQAQASLTNLSMGELKDLLNDDDKLEERINELLVGLESEKEVVMNENRQIAEDNMGKEPLLIEKRGMVNDLAEEGKTICADIQELLTKIKEKSGATSKETALALLQTAAAQCEEESDELVKQLLASDLTVEIFLEKFFSSRKTMHLRKVKADKMIELIRSGRNSAVYPGSSGFYPPQSTGFPSISGLPYPMGSIAMPMPGMSGPNYRPF